MVLTACHTPPIATASLLTYMLLRDLHPDFHRLQGWRAVVGVYGGKWAVYHLYRKWADVQIWDQTQLNGGNLPGPRI